jgi:hypothetical protein
MKFSEVLLFPQGSTKFHEKDFSLKNIIELKLSNYIVT